MAAAHDLLFGVLALQNRLIDQVQLVAAFQAWTRAKGRPLAEHLAARGDLGADTGYRLIEGTPTPRPMAGFSYARSQP
jgi:hypothetical protein